jgi:uncharacterized sporulation protein YeaH/YhbH (DUF444 family)
MDLAHLAPLAGLLRIVDRRGDPPGRGAINRERFIRRYKDEIRRAADEEFARRSIRDLDKGGRVRIPGRGLDEPRLTEDAETGERDYVLPGNREYVPGDLIDRPPAGEGKGQGDEPGEGEGRDSFAFALSREEFLALFFDDLELPNLERTRFGETSLTCLRRGGTSREGLPTHLLPVQTVRMAIARRIALRGAIDARLRELDAPQDEGFPDEPPDDTREDLAGLLTLEMPVAIAAAAERKAEALRLRERRDHLPFLEDVDRRYRARVPATAPSSRAAMICLMDVSGSMDERKKDLAKRFFSLLYLFLERKYGQVEIVFIRHTEQAEEVDEERFFNDPQSGGTLVLPALTLASEVIARRFAGPDWNVYMAQASDGDCGADDGRRSAEFAASQLMPVLRYFAYIDIPGAHGWFARQSDLWQSYEVLEDAAFARRSVRERSDIWPVFRELFARRSTA